MHARDAPTIRTFSGKAFWPLEPRAADVDIVDIAHALANLCRFSGHCRRFYSVAQHSCLVADIVEPPHRGWGLLHDAGEAYLGDMVASVKIADVQLGAAYRDAEDKVVRVIAQRFGLAWPEPDEVVAADRALLVAEFRDLMPLREGELESLVERHGPAYPARVVPWSPNAAQAAFLDSYRRFQQAGELQ